MRTVSRSSSLEKDFEPCLSQLVLSFLFQFQIDVLPFTVIPVTPVTPPKNFLSQNHKLQFTFRIYFRALLSKFGDRSREFSKSDSKVHYFVLLNPTHLDMFIFIAIYEEKRHSVGLRIFIFFAVCELTIGHLSAKMK